MAIKPPSTNPNTASTPQALTFPAQTFAKLSPSAYLTAHLTSPHGPLRPSGRKPSESRPPTVHTGSLTHTHGSAVVRCGDTAVVCGIRGEILKVEDVADWESIRRQQENIPTDSEGTIEPHDTTTEEEKKRQRRKQDTAEISNLHLLVPNIDLATGCSPAHLATGPPSLQAQTLTHRIHTLLHTSHLLNMDDLQIWSLPPPPSSPAPQSGMDEAQEDTEPLEKMAEPEIKAYWTLYIDLLFISLSGSAFDTAWLALLAALHNVRLPKAYYDTDTSSVLCSPLTSDARKLNLNDIPIPLSFGVFHGEGEGGAKGEGKGRTWILVDMDGFEEGLCKEVGTVVVGEGGRVVRVEKGGGGVVGGKEMGGLVEKARGRREEWVGVLEKG